MTEQEPPGLVGRRHLGLAPGPVSGAGASDSAVVDVLDALGELDVAHEELRVADRALREQEAQLTDLLSRHQAEQRWRDRLSALVPVSQLVTDVQGVVVEADAASVRLSGVAADRLVGKPLTVFLDPADRAPLRRELVRLAAGVEEVRLSLPLSPRGSTVPQRVDAVGLLEATAGRPQVRWVLVPQTAVATAAATTPAGVPDDAELGVAGAIARLCLLPVGAADQQAVIGQMAVIVRDAVPSATWASVTIGPPSDPERLASDSVEAQRVDGLQLQLEQGPCDSAFETGTVVVTGDLAGDDRWPRLARAVQHVPVRSVLALPVVSASRRLGVLNVYADRHDAFEARDRRIGELVASAVSAVLTDVGEKVSLQALTAHLQRALDSRAVIEQAKGIVMAHHGGTPDEAFARLVTLSNRHNVKLRDLAGLLVEGGAGSGLRPWLAAGEG